jgi:hypothetical protein
LQVDRDMFGQTNAVGQRFEADGELVLRSAHIGGQLNLRGARVTNAKGLALDAEGLQVDRNMFCHTDDRGQRFEADGELRLLSTHIGGELNLRGAHVTNAKGPALDAEGLQVDRDMFCHTDDGGQRFEADGGLRLLGAHIGGQLSLKGAHLTNAKGLALDAQGLQVDENVLCETDDVGQRFEADGELRLRGAHIATELSLTDADLKSGSGLTLDFQQGRARRLVLPQGMGSDAIVDLRYAALTEFEDDPARRGVPGYRARVTGFTYDTVVGPAGRNCRARLAWLARATDGYVPHAYDQLAAAFRRAGRDDDAKTVMIAKQVRRRGTLSRAGKVASLAFGAPVGYGYRTWRGIAALVAIVLIGWPIFAHAYPKNMTATRASKQLPEFHALFYSADAVLPVVNLGQETAWSPRGGAQAWYGFSVLAGWLLGLGLVAFVTARVFRE